MFLLYLIIPYVCSELDDDRHDFRGEARELRRKYRSQ
jgi:hypothetical protein